MYLLYVHSLCLCSTDFFIFFLARLSFQKNSFSFHFHFFKTFVFPFRLPFSIFQNCLQNTFGFSSPFLFRLFFASFESCSFGKIPASFLLQKYQNFLSTFCHLHFSERVRKDLVSLFVCFESAHMKRCSLPDSAAWYRSPLATCVACQ